MTAMSFEDHRFGDVVLKLDAVAHSCIMTVQKPGFGVVRGSYHSLEEVIAGHAVLRGRAAFDPVSKDMRDALAYAGKRMRGVRDPEAHR